MRLALGALAAQVSIYKIDYPDAGYCGEESNVTQSNLNPHYFFPIHFGGFHEGDCADAGYGRYLRTETVAMHPVPGVHHNLTFDVYGRNNGEITIELPDPARNRTVKAKVCMPEHSAPLLVFGHGFDCAPADYEYFCTVAVTALVYEKSASASFLDTDTKDLALDQAFLAQELPRQAQDPQSPLFGKLDGTAVVGGHSMGGGTSVMAATEAPVAGVVLFAPGLYTMPSATPFLQNVTAPAIVVSGSDDCGPNQLPKEAQPCFDGLASSKKVLVVLKGANHCQWAKPTEKFGVCNLPVFKECALITPEAQQASGVRLAGGFMRGLASDAAWDAFEADLAKGLQDGTWDYVSSKTTPGKKLHNDCPCKKQQVFV